METYNEINDKHKNLSIALGFFDGIHIGHKAVLDSAVSYAEKHADMGGAGGAGGSPLASAVVTFENHPRCFFSKCQPEYILSKKEKLKLFEQLGFDYVYFLKFDDYLANLSAGEYLDFLYENLQPKAISTGFNHTFGANKTGNTDFLEKNQSKYGYTYFKSAPVKIDNQIVSSSKIRENLKCGNIEQVNKMLGRKYSLEETVVEGEKIGRTLGFKTANLIYPKDMLNIARGVYSTIVEYNGEKFKGVANFGMRPSLGNTDIPILEVHLLDFEKEIYGEKIKVEFITKIRDEKKFGSLEELKTQIQNDIMSANYSSR